MKISKDPFQKLRDEKCSLNYFLCGYKAVLEFDEKIAQLVKVPVGMKILIDSNLPQAGGLSSSAAMVVCTAITTAHANGILDKIPQTQMAYNVWQTECKAGTMCGAMD